MYPKYFGLKEPSFSIAPDPHYLFLSDQHKEALAHLLYGAGETGGFVLLTGEVGTGKTTVCRAFLEQLPAGVDVALIVNPAMTANELLLNICDEFRIPVPEGERSVKSLVDRLNRYLLDAHADGRRPVLMIDEAQNLRPKVMEQVRLLTNLETTKNKLLQIFLVGQPELRRMLEREGLRQINQRITARFHLRPLGLAETGDYIRHRVAVAGVDRPLFTASAVRRIHQVSGGVPRLINILCDRALLGACVTRSNQVSPAIVAKAAREVQGERLEEQAASAVRPAFAGAAALALVLVAGWLAYAEWRGDPRELVAALLEHALPVSGQAEPPGLRFGAGSAPGTRAGPPAPAAPEPQVATAVAVPSAIPAEVEVQVQAAPAALTPAPVSVAPPASAVEPEVDGVAAAASAPTEPEVAEGVPPAEPATRVPAPDPVLAAQPDLPLISMASFVPEAANATLARIALPEDRALRVLLRRWGLTVQDLGGGDPCLRVAAFGLGCEREQGRLSHVRFFDLPALLRVADHQGEPRYVVLGALDRESATLDLETGSERVPVAGLESVWTGDYTLLWQPPPTGAPLIGPGASGDSVRWLRRLVADLPGSSLAYTDLGEFDGALSAAVRAFQSSRGLSADGLAGPRTLIQIHNALARSGVPRLTQPLAAAHSALGSQASVQSLPGAQGSGDLP